MPAGVFFFWSIRFPHRLDHMVPVYINVDRSRKRIAKETAVRKLQRLAAEAFPQREEGVELAVAPARGRVGPLWRPQLRHLGEDAGG